MELLHGASPISGPVPGPILLRPRTRGWQERGFDHRGVYISGKHQPWAQSVGKQQHDGAILPSTSRTFWGPQQGGWRWGFTRLTLLPKTFLGASPPRRLPPRVLSLTLSHPWAGRLLLGRVPLGFPGPPLGAVSSPSSAFPPLSARLRSRFCFFGHQETFLPCDGHPPGILADDAERDRPRGGLGGTLPGHGALRGVTQPCGFPPVHPQLFLFFPFSSPLQGARGGLPVCVERGWRGNRNLEGKNNPRNSLPPALPCFLRCCRHAGTAPWLQSPLCVPCLSPFLPTPGDSGNVTQLLSVWPRGKRSQRMGKSVTGQKRLARQRAVSRSANQAPAESKLPLAHCIPHPKGQDERCFRLCGILWCLLWG